jgi:hypothetical protein
MCFDKEKALNGSTVKRSVFERIQQLEDAERSAKIITYTDYKNNETRQALIDEVQFVSQYTPSPNSQESQGGILLVTLRTID